MSIASLISNASTRHLHWYYRGQGVLIKFPSFVRGKETNLFYAHSHSTFMHVQLAMMIPEQNISYPHGVTSTTKILDFLNEGETPQVVTFVVNGEEKILKNSGWYLKQKHSSRDSLVVRSILKSPNSIYSLMNRYVLDPSQQTKTSARINYFLQHFYLRLAAQTYCRVNRIVPSQAMTAEIARSIIDYIGEQFQNDSPISIKQAQEEESMIQSRMMGLKEQIKHLQDLCERTFGFYKWGAVAITTAHILSFGYMIFFVDWLGWDIIEPLTYTVGVVYTLLGIRFYRKYKMDRTTQNIKEIILKQVINPARLLQLKGLRNRLAIDEAQLSQVRARNQILKNRINFRTSLCESISKYDLV